MEKAFAQGLASDSARLFHLDSKVSSSGGQDSLTCWQSWDSLKHDPRGSRLQMAYFLDFDGPQGIVEMYVEKRAAKIAEAWMMSDPWAIVV